jgi:predicted lysophospholipase L1 biosynthesis ABC-type transport system permease subunit
VGDAQILASQPYAASVTPTVSTSANLRFGAVEASALVNGVGEQYFDVRGSVLVQGRFFDADDVRRFAQDVVIDENALQVLFPPGSRNPIGAVVLIGAVPCRIIGVMRFQQGGFGGSQNPQVYLPYTTVQGRFLGDLSLRSISLRVTDDTSTEAAQEAVTELLTHRHRATDFFMRNTDEIRRAITGTTETMTLLIASIAVISLLVGGIGVMNIMLVSVIERTGEIGLRMAVGARRSDIMQQFLIEASLVCFIGGVLGIGLALAIGTGFGLAGSPISFVYSGEAFVAAIACSTLIGLTFGCRPATPPISTRSRRWLGELDPLDLNNLSPHPEEPRSGVSKDGPEANSSASMAAALQDRAVLQHEDAVRIWSILRDAPSERASALLRMRARPSDCAAPSPPCRGSGSRHPRRRCPAAAAPERRAGFPAAACLSACP